MDEIQQNDLQDVQLEENELGEGEAAEEVVADTSEVDTLRAELAAKDEQIANLSRQKREAKKANKPEPKLQKEETKQSEGLDYGQKAYLKGEGIESAEFDFVHDQMQESGMEMDTLLENGYFKSELQDRRDKAANEAATPSGTRGAKKAAGTEVEHWINRGELPENTPENTELRREVVRRRTTIEKNKEKFASQGIVDTAQGA